MLIRNGKYRRRTEYTPQKGDLIVFSYEPGWYSHIGIVEKVENGRVYTIEGNIGSDYSNYSEVGAKNYSLDNKNILGYINIYG